MTTTYTNKNIDLDKLTRAPENVRKMGKAKAIDELAAQIAAQGLIQPLTVVKKGQSFEVLAGARRLQALQKLADAGQWSGPVPCRLADTQTDTLDKMAISLAENFGQLPMHQLDRLRVIDDLTKKGMSVEQIAARFGLEVAAVKKTISLHGLALPIKQAFANGEIEESAALAYASTKDKAAQISVFENAGHWTDAGTIKRRLRSGLKITGETMTEDHRFFRAIGQEAYEEDGGTYSSDLFTDDNKRKVDGKRVIYLVEEKMKTLGDELKSINGAAWVKTSFYNEPHLNEHYLSWDDDQPCPTDFGFFVWINWRGDIQTSRQLIKRADWLAHSVQEGDEGREGDGSKEEGETRLDGPEIEVEQGDGSRPPSRPMLLDAGASLTSALQNAISEDFGAAFDLLLERMIIEAAHNYGSQHLINGCPTIHGHSKLEQIAAELIPVDARDFSSVVASLDADQKQRLFAALVAGTVDAAQGTYDGRLKAEPKSKAVTVANKLSINMHDDWPIDDRRAYLERMSKQDLCATVLKLEGEALASILQKDKKTIVDRALSVRWLPDYFRGIEGQAATPLQIAAE